jgi:hypothetical protein
MKRNKSRSGRRFAGMIMMFMVTMNILCAREYSDSLKIYLIRTSDKNEFTGHILHEDDEVIVVKTEMLDSLVIRKEFVKHIEPVGDGLYRNGKVWLNNPQAARYLWMPNGYGLKKGEGYYQNVWVLFNQASIGVTDYFSIGMGMIPVFLFGTAEVPLWFTPKISLPVVKDKFNLGAGAFIATVLNEGSAGLAYGLATIGSPDKNLTIGVGYGRAGGSWSNAPTINISGMIRVSTGTYLMTENYFIGTGDGLVTLFMFGGRSFSKRMSIDYGLLIPDPRDLEVFIAIPWLGITIPFGNARKPLP